MDKILVGNAKQLLEWRLRGMNRNLRNVKTHMTEDNAMRVVDADSHFVEPLDLFSKRVDSKYRDMALRFEQRGGELAIVIEGKPLPTFGGEKIVEKLLGNLAGFGEREKGTTLDEFDPAWFTNPDWQDMGKRVRFLDEEGIDAQVIFPSFFILIDGLIGDPSLATAHSRAYNDWAFEQCSAHNTRLYPAAHVTLQDPLGVVKELQRVAKLGFRTAMLNAVPHRRMSYGNSAYDPVWAAAQDLDISVGIHIANAPEFVGFQWYQDHERPELLFPGMCSFLGPRLALTTMMVDGVFERFPKLRVATIEARVGWVAEWIELMERYCQYAIKTTRMKRPPREYFGVNIWLSGDADESVFGPVVKFIGDGAFLVGSDYPHVEGAPHPIVKAQKTLSQQLLAPLSIERILGGNGCRYLGI